jgi:predicted  nucleic acid-binding Zn-ribbon protein
MVASGRVVALALLVAVLQRIDAFRKRSARNSEHAASGPSRSFINMDASNSNAFIPLRKPTRSLQPTKDASKKASAHTTAMSSQVLGRQDVPNADNRGAPQNAWYAGRWPHSSQAVWKADEERRSYVPPVWGEHGKRRSPPEAAPSRNYRLIWKSARKGIGNGKTWKSVRKDIDAGAPRKESDVAKNDVLMGQVYQVLAQIQAVSQELVASKHSANVANEHLEGKVNEFYSMQDHAVKLQTEIDQLKYELRTSESQLGQTHQATGLSPDAYPRQNEYALELQTLIKRRRGEIHNVERQLAQLLHDLKLRGDELDSDQTMLNQLRAEVDHQDHELTSAQEHIAKLKKDLESMHDTVHNASSEQGFTRGGSSDQVGFLNHQLRAAETKLNHAEGEITRLRNADDTLRRMHGDIESLDDQLRHTVHDLQERDHYIEKMTYCVQQQDGDLRRADERCKELQMQLEQKEVELRSSLEKTQRYQAEHTKKARNFAEANIVS